MNTQELVAEARNIVSKMERKVAHLEANPWDDITGKFIKRARLELARAKAIVEAFDAID